MKKWLKGIKKHLFSAKEDFRGQKGDKPYWSTISKGPLTGMRYYVSDKWGEMINGNYDNFIFKSLADNGIDLEGKTVWDVGAHIGYHTLAFSKLVGKDGKIVSFEPNPYNLERLRLHLQKNPQYSGNVEIFDIALSESDGYHSFVLNKNVDNAKSSGSFLDYGHLPSDRFNKRTYDDFFQVNVKVMRPDSFLVNHETFIPDFIKLDIEGAEVQFLNGAHNLILCAKPTLVIEVHNIQNMFEVSQILHLGGYEMFLLDDEVYSSSRCFILAKFG